MDMETRKKRVLIIADSNLSNSGVPMVFMSIVRALSDFSFDVVVFDEDDMFYKDEFLSYGGNIFVLNRNIPKNKIKKLLWLHFGLGKLIKKFCNEQIEIKKYYAIHSFDELFSSMFFKIAKKEKVKYRIIHICAAFRAYKNKKSLRKYLFEFDRRKTFRLCTSIACSSDSTLKLNNYKNKGVTLYRTYNERQFPGIIECEFNGLSLTQIGTFSSRKNQLFSLKVLKEIKKSYPNVVLNFVGKEMEVGYEVKMKDFIKNNNLVKNVNFLGTNPNRQELSKITSYVLHPSTMEGSGNVLVESQVCGIHCFASNTLPEGYDLGNVQYFELSYRLWAQEIKSFYEKNGNVRKLPENKEKFSKENFKNIVLKMMI